MIVDAEQFIGLMKSEQQNFHSVVPFDRQHDKLLSLDLSSGNGEINDDLFNRTNDFTQLISDRIKAAGARYAIGGYGELRSIYGQSRNFDDDANGSEPRRFHLGMDIWSKPHTPVTAPLKGIVHSFANNDGIGDYGATIILSHALRGEHFYTLYGHLSLSSIKNMREGQRIDHGDIFAEFGIPAENGHWPPHLHFQIILDMEDRSGDYPGVCKYSEREKYLQNSPDPDLILQLNKYLA